MHALAAIVNVALALVAIGLVLAHKGRDGGLGSPAGHGLSAVERPLTRATIAVMILWMASGILEAAWR